MSQANTQTVIDYFNGTRVEYRLLWHTHRSYSMHFGYYDEQHQSHDAAVSNMNQKLAKLAGITRADSVFDAGCGVGGSAFWLAEHIGCKVMGVSVVPRQVARAKQFAEQRHLKELVSFRVADYSDTGLVANSFSVVWGLESIVHAEDKRAVLNEAYRILKPGGRLIIAEYLLKEKPLTAWEQSWLSLWLKGWAMGSILTEKQYREIARQAGFTDIKVKDWTTAVSPSLRRARRWSRFFRPLSPLLLALHLVNKRQIGNRVATESQMKLLKNGCWRYKALLVTKPE